ncbi:hypothetical protein [Paraburkholderia sp. SIMBA_030]|uniref:hypothetical protein n=1 Tax=Paraburkholderia sp. SIMBA_030 TaxID=3085773 RepID=UPI00397D1D3D
MHEEKRPFRRFLRAVAIGCQSLRSRANSFIGGISAMQNVFNAAERVAEYGNVEMCSEPLAAGLAREGGARGAQFRKHW